MSEGKKTKTCNSCTTTPRRQWSWVPAIAVAILPKCPFCIMAYAGAIPLCGGNSIYPNIGSFSIYITIGLALVVLLSVFLNYKGARTWWSSITVLIGITCLATSQLWWPSMLLYYLGVTVIFFGIWYNGSFAFFQRKISSYLSNLHFRIKSLINDDSRTV